MAYLLNCVYLLVLVVASPWLVYSALCKGKYRAGWWEKLLGQVPKREGNRPCLWLHAVSVGEVNLLATLVGELRQRQPEAEIVISTTTATGYALAKKKYAEHTVFYCPLDFSWAVRNAVRRIRPDWLVLAELELWPNLIRAARWHGARVAVVNGRLSEQSFRGYRRVRPLMKHLLGQIDVLAVQNESYAARFRDLGAAAERVRVTGSLKFDGAQTHRANSATQALRELAGFADDDVIWLAGSTQAPEEERAVSIFRKLADSFPNLRLVLVPRHPERFDEVARLLDSTGLRWRRRSKLNPDKSSSARILLVDTIGELGAWWGTADIAFVGGSFGDRGGQNMIEPAAYGAAVSFGPNTWNFRDIVAVLLERQAAVQVDDLDELTAFVRRCLREPEFARQLGQQAQFLVREQLGATSRTVDLLLAAAQAAANSSPALSGARTNPREAA